MKKQLSLIMLAILLISMMSFLGNNISHVRASATYYVSNSGNDANPGTEASPWEYIQYAVTHVGTGGTIIVEAGTYDEQVVISQALTLEGVGDATIIKPGAFTLSQVYTVDGGTWDGWNLASIIIVEGVSSGTVTIENLQVNGINVNIPVGYSSCYPVGIAYGESSGTLQNVTIVNMNTTTYVDRSYGIWLNAFSTAVSDTVRDCTVVGYYRNGIMTTGDMLTFDINGNTVTGPGTIGPVQLPNGICIADGSGGSVSYNTITENHYNNLGDITDYPWLSIGIIGWNEAPGTTISDNILHNNDEGIAPTSGDLIYNNQIFDNMWGIELEEGAANNTIQFNNITENTVGIHLLGPGDPWYTGLGDEPGTGNLATLNNIVDNTVGVHNWDTNQTFSAERNWWGSATGPGPVGPGMGDNVSSCVDYTLWLEKEYSSTETCADYMAAIISAANRLVSLQSSTDYGWDWIVNTEPPWTGTSATNLYGVTALSLIDAYVKTKNSTYLTAAENTASFMMYGDPSAGDFYHGHGSYSWGYSFDYEFLMELSTVSGNSSYSNYALAAWAWQKANRSQRYGDGNQSALWEYYLDNWVGTNMSGAADWGTSAWGLAALAMGDTVWAEHMAAVIDANMGNILTGNRTIDYVDMGMGEALQFLVALGNVSYTADINNLVAALKADQLSDNSWDYGPPPPGDPQTTAYVVMGLMAAGDSTDARKGADWLLATQLTDAPGGWLEWDGNEYSEIDSEVLQALTSSIVAPMYTYTKANFENAIVGAANRLVALQSLTDYGWDWIVTGLTSHSANPSATNIYGVTALGLIASYEQTGNSTYLNAANNIADFITYGNASAGDFWNGIPPDYIYYWGYSFDYKFLKEFSTITGEPTYANYAQAAWAWQTSAASEPSIPDLRYMDGNQSYLYNYFVSGPGWGGAWQASDYGLAAWEMGDTTWAQHMASVISSNLGSIISAATQGGSSKDMNMAWSLKLLVTVDPTRATYASNITALINDLKNDQSFDGSWDEQVETTAYAVMGLLAAGEYTTALKGADWLVATQMTNTPGGWLESNGNEYSETDSEAMQALAASIVTLTVSSAHNSPIPSGTTTYFAGTIVTASITSPIAGPAGTRYVCTGWSGTGSVPSSGTGTSVTFNIGQDSSITWNWKTQCNVTFDEAGVGKDFTGTVVTIDGENYGVTGLPVSFWYDNGSSHSFSFASQLAVNVNKTYTWNFTTGLTTLQSDPLKVNASGYVVGNYILKNAITFATIGVYSDFTGTVVTIDGTPYNFTSLPLSFKWTVGSKHSFAFQSPLLIAANTKQYVWTSTTGSLTFAQSGYITVTTYGIIVGNYKTQYYLTLATSPPGINAPTGAGWCDSGTYATISTTQYVPGPGSSRYSFNGWTTTDMREIINPSSISTTVLVNEAKTVTANYVQIHCVAVTNIIPEWTGVPYGRTVPINVTVTNQGDFPENVTITLEGSYFTLGTETITDLRLGTTQTLIFNWNTTGFPEKDYRMLTDVALSPGETNTAQNTFIDDWISVTKIGNLGARVQVSPGVYQSEFGVFTGQVTSVDLDLFLQCYHGTAPPQYMYLADLGSRVWNATANSGKGAYENEFFMYKVVNGVDVVNSADLNLELLMYHGIAHPDP